DVSHGYVRASDGTITTFDPPGIGTGPGQGSVPQNINAPGVVVGQYFDASNLIHGFVRTTQGAITTFDVPGAGTGPFQGTVPLCNNPVDVITGYYIDASDVFHGFLRSPNTLPHNDVYAWHCLIDFVYGRQSVEGRERCYIRQSRFY